MTKRMRQEIIDNIRPKLEETLHGNCIADYITKKDMVDYLNDFDKWSETANLNDIYHVCDEDFVFSLT